MNTSLTSNFWEFRTLHALNWTFRFRNRNPNFNHSKRQRTSI